MPRGKKADGDLRDRVCKYALRRFVTAGPSGVTMEEIARACGVGKATLYREFESKDGLLRACVEHAAEAVSAAARVLLDDESLSPVEKLRRFIGVVPGVISEHGISQLDDLRRVAPDVWELVDTARRRVITRYVSRIFAQGMEQGIFRRDLKPEFIAHLLAGAFASLTSPAAVAELDLPASQLIGGVFSVILEGCLAKPGKAG